MSKARKRRGRQHRRRAKAALRNKAAVRKHVKRGGRTGAIRSAQLKEGSR